jgi:hypothetical protein
VNQRISVEPGVVQARPVGAAGLGEQDVLRRRLDVAAKRRAGRVLAPVARASQARHHQLAPRRERLARCVLDARFHSHRAIRRVRQNIVAQFALLRERALQFDGRQSSRFAQGVHHAGLENSARRVPGHGVAHAGRLVFKVDSH